MSLTLRNHTGKTEWEYWDAIHFTFRLAGCKIKSSYVYCDFEKALINAVSEQFNDAYIVGCLFHFKQALRKYLISKLKMNEEIVDMAMEKNCLDILTIIPKAEIKKKGIPYVKSILSTIEMNEEEKQMWEEFWVYFVKFWCSLPEFIATWNIH